MEDTQKKPDLGMVFPVPVKKNPTSYDLRGHVMIDGKKYSLKGYKQEAGENSKLGAGAIYYKWHRVEEQTDELEA